MSQVVDELEIVRRSAVPYQSNEAEQDVRNPIPTDVHLIPSGELAKKPTYPDFIREHHTAPVHDTGKPWAAYERPNPEVFSSMPNCFTTTAEPEPEPRMLDEEMWRTQYIEWTLQKNAYNPNIAAELRTNVRKQAALSMVDPSLTQDPARTSENIKSILTDSEVIGPAPKVYKPKLTLDNVFPR